MLQVAGRLWHLVLVCGGLVQHLTALKDYFLLARGDFYQALLSEVSNKHPPLHVYIYTPATHPRYYQNGHACFLLNHTRPHSLDTRPLCAMERMPQVPRTAQQLFEEIMFLRMRRQSL